jgi:hypothetical protein
MCVYGVAGDGDGEGPVLWRDCMEAPDGAGDIETKGHRRPVSELKAWWSSLRSEMVCRVHENGLVSKSNIPRENPRNQLAQLCLDV